MREKSELAGKTVTIISGTYKGAEYLIEDWVENVMGQSWKDCTGNPACLNYAMRASSRDNLILDDNVLYGKIGCLGELIHIREIDSKHSQGD